jgi:hypothetical protein
MVPWFRENGFDGAVSGVRAGELLSKWLATGRTLKESSAGRSFVISIIIGSTIFRENDLFLKPAAVLAERFRKRLDR